MNRNDKNKKFTPLNINNVFKGKSNETQNKTNFRVAGMQNIGKVSSNRRVPAPKWVPSIKAESGGSENRQIINQASSGWVSSAAQEGADQNVPYAQSLLNKDRNQWISKGLSNKPFFLMGQEFPSLPSDVIQDLTNDSTKDSNKSKETESVKSKLDELRHRDNKISASTLNRIDALSISKSSKGDIAATGWAAEDEEPNFDEKIVFSDEESMNETHNWHSDLEIPVSKSENQRVSQSEIHEPQLSISDTWFEQSQVSHYPQYPQFQMQMNMSPNQFLASNPQFQQAVNRPPGSNVGDDHSAFVAEQRNARNMEYYIAIERARQKKMGPGRTYGGFGEDGPQSDHLLTRSRHTSMTSDITESNNTPIEMGPPGGPPLIYGHLHRPHISPMISHPMISPPPMTGPPLIQFTQPPPFMMPIQAVSLEHITDSKLMEKWVEFLKQQSTGKGDVTSEIQVTNEHQIKHSSSGSIEPRNVLQDTSATRQSFDRTMDSKNVSEDNSSRQESKSGWDTTGTKQVFSRAMDSRSAAIDGQVARQGYNRAVVTRTADNRARDTSSGATDIRNNQEGIHVSKQNYTRAGDRRIVDDGSYEPREVHSRTLDSKNSAIDPRSGHDDTRVTKQAYNRAADPRKTDDNSYETKVTYNKSHDSKKSAMDSWNVQDTFAARDTCKRVVDPRKVEGNVDTRTHDPNSGGLDSRNVRNDCQVTKQTYNKVVNRRKVEDSNYETRNVDNKTRDSNNGRDTRDDCHGPRKTSLRAANGKEEANVARQPAIKVDNWRSVQKKAADILPPPTSHEKIVATEKKDEYDTNKRTEGVGASVKDGTHKTKPIYGNVEDGTKTDSSKRMNHNKYGNYKEYRASRPNYRGGEYGSATDQDYGQGYRDNCDEAVYDDYSGYQQYGYGNDDYRNSYDYHKNAPYQYYDDSYQADNADYNYKSNSLKYKSSRHKDYLKPSNSQTDCNQSESVSNVSKRKTGTDSHEKHYPEKDNYDGTGTEANNEVLKSTKTSTSGSVNKRYDNRPYKDRPTEPKQEFSMGFAVNPNDSRRNYYPSNYNRRQYNNTGEYSSYSNSGSNNQYKDNYNDNYYPPDNNYYHQDNKYYQSDSKYPSDNKRYPSEQQYVPASKYQSERTAVQDRAPSQYDHDTATAAAGAYSSSSSKGVKKPLKSEQWRTKDSKGKAENNGPSKSNGRGNRKNDKRQSSMTKDNVNDIDHEEWETASEGGSDRINGTARDGYKPSTRHHAVDKHATNEDSNQVNQSSDNDNRGSTENRYGLTNSCNGTWPSYPDEDENDGASGPSGGGRTVTVTSNVSSQQRTTDSTQNQSSDNTSNTNSNKTGTNVPASNSNIGKKCSGFIDMINSSSVINVDKLPEVTEDEELLYENVEQFQEVLSKATKKNRRLEEQRKLKEELEQKRLEELRLKNRNDAKSARKPVNRKDQSQQKSDKGNCSRKVDIKASVVNNRDKEVLNNSSNTSNKYECNKVSMPIGSWDNSLADDINFAVKEPPKPIGTPASTSSWNVKLRSFPKSSPTMTVNLKVSQEGTKTIKENGNSAIDAKNGQSSKNIYSTYDSDVKYNSIFDITDKHKQIKEQLEPQSIDIHIPVALTFDYNVKNVNCESFEKDGLVSERVLQKNNQQLLNEKINSVKTIWDNQPLGNSNNQSDNTRALVTAQTSTVVNVDIDTDHTTATSNNTVRNIDTNLVTPTMSNTNVCKVKPQLQKETQNSSMVQSSPFIAGNSSATYIAQNQGNFMTYPHRFPSEYLQDHLQAADCLTSLLGGNQPPVMHFNYNLPNQHHLPTEHMLSSKMNFISQQSFYPQAAVTPKLFSNAGGQLPLNMDIGSSHHGSLPLQQLLLTRQNSLTTMIQPTGMSLPFIQSGQQHAHNSQLYPNNQILGPAQFSPQIHPFSPGHYSPGNFTSLHPNHHLQQSQLLLNHHQQQQHQQMLQSQISHDRVINSGQSGIFNSIMGPSDISTNAGLPDFNGQSKHLTHNNIMHGMNGSAIMLPHNLNYLMKPHHFASNSQYNNFPVPIQSNHVNVRNSYENHSNIKLATEVETFRSSKNCAIDRQAYCTDNIIGLSKPNEEIYVDQNNYENCAANSDNWTSNVRRTNSNNFLQSFDFQQQRSSIQIPFFDLNLPFNDSDYQTSINNNWDNHASLSTNVHGNSISLSSHRDKQQLRQTHKPGNTIKQIGSGYDSVTCIDTDFTSNKKKPFESKKDVCDSTVTSEHNDINHSEKSFSKKNKSQRSSFADNFNDGNVCSGSNCDDINLEVDSHNKQYNNNNNLSRQHLFNNQYGYNDTQLSSQTAESLGKFDSAQLKKMIMKLREGPVMTFADSGRADSGSSSGGAGGHHGVVKRSTVVPGGMYKCPRNDSDNDYAFYSRNGPRAPSSQSRTYKVTSSNNDSCPSMDTETESYEHDHCDQCPSIDIIASATVDNNLLIATDNTVR